MHMYTFTKTQSKIWITGFSYGAALATVFTSFLSSNFTKNDYIEHQHIKKSMKHLSGMYIFMYIYIYTYIYIYIYIHILY